MNLSFFCNTAYMLYQVKCVLNSLRLQSGNDLKFRASHVVTEAIQIFTTLLLSVSVVKKLTLDY